MPVPAAQPTLKAAPKLDMKKKGLVVSGINDELNLVEMIEIESHRWFVGVQFHPELKSRIVKAHPLFDGFIRASIAFNETNP